MNNKEVIRLKKAFLFQGLPDEMIEALAQKVNRRQLAEAEALIHRGDEGDALYVIDEGRVKIVTADAQGGELIINECGPGETIGEMSLLDRAPRSADVIALTRTEVLELKQDAFFDLLDQRSDLTLNIIRSISARLRFSTTYIQKAIEWSKKIAEGDYSFMEQIQPGQDNTQRGTDEDKAGQLLSAFFHMVKGVKEREEKLKQQVEKLTLAIDETKRRQEFEELTSTDFYANLKAQAKMIRQQRQDN